MKIVIPNEHHPPIKLFILWQHIPTQVFVLFTSSMTHNSFSFQHNNNTVSRPKTGRSETGPSLIGPLIRPTVLFVLVPHAIMLRGN